MIRNVLSIAGSDPSGGAGIQADLKTFAARGVYGMAVITALTAQNTRGVSGVETVSPGFVADQIEAIFEDVRVDAVKIGMIADAAIARAVAGVLSAHAV
ncbi:MAG TPA: bifunctional hydroxymethylpyrimidine kinase/phosphomethylpyrimidine kinase, partial [Thermomicrobiales bacterium]|nr:bifunctional hydroxymethylpyrimidine kinase/phosphomethylpyrimidine kinase [Thermomicrobiales bacterium]